ncbi:Late embryogenesis abundant protein [Vitis vinifera]|uniref:Late embryogenesis abundant protein n=1 Tax=Vitis vinifera TaxID=29760 RepID=A0A438J520_VITVI|nr:Late embryogenesis abundant protein [Vitis vinifera]
MPEDNQFQPLAPARLHGKSDEEFGVFKPRASKPPRRSSKCPVYVLAGLVTLAAIALVFALAVLRVEAPGVELKSVANKNYGAFNYENGTATVLYEGMVVGDEEFSKAHVESRKTKRMNVTLDVRSDRLWNDKNLSSDISSGSVNLTTYAR